MGLRTNASSAVGSAYREEQSCVRNNSLGSVFQSETTQSSCEQVTAVKSR